MKKNSVDGSFMDTTFTFGANREVLECFRMALKARNEKARLVLVGFMREYAVAAYADHPTKFTLHQAAQIKFMKETIEAGI
jgi:hypothetical protein